MFVFKKMYLSENKYTIMKKVVLIFSVCCLFASTTLLGQARDYYQLKVYSFDNDAQMATTDTYLKDA